MKLSTYDATVNRSRSVARPAVGLLMLAVLLTLSFVGSALSAPASVDLGDTASFGALSATAMTNAGANTVVSGNVGSSTSIGAGVTHPGFGAYGAGSSELANAQASLLTAYGFAEAQTPTDSITGLNFAGRTLGPGVYNSTSGILISEPVPLTLDGGGDSGSVFIFQAPSSGDLTVDAGANFPSSGERKTCRRSLHACGSIRRAKTRRTSTRRCSRTRGSSTLPATAQPGHARRGRR